MQRRINVVANERNHRWPHSDSAKFHVGAGRRDHRTLMQSRVGADAALAIIEPIFFNREILFD